jgi:hypothetical protein
MQPQRPQMSYIAMIAMAILSTPDEHMKLSDICQFLEDNFAYYRTSQSNWRSAIRHNLSVNSCFLKTERPGAGRGSMWTIHPACMEDFRRGDYRRTLARKRVQTDFNVRNTTLTVHQGSTSPHHQASSISTSIYRQTGLVTPPIGQSSQGGSNNITNTTITVMQGTTSPHHHLTGNACRMPSSSPGLSLQGPSVPHNMGRQPHGPTLQRSQYDSDGRNNRVVISQSSNSPHHQTVNMSYNVSMFKPPQGSSYVQYLQKLQPNHSKLQADKLTQMNYRWPVDV